MQTETVAYNANLSAAHRPIADLLAARIDAHLPGAVNRIWHGHPVWFLDDNPIVGYSPQKPGLRLMFWSGADFGEPALDVRGKKFKDASIFYTAVSDVSEADLQRWLQHARAIQWDYRNIVRRKGRLERLPS